MQFYFYIIDRKSNGRKMVKGTRLAAPKEKLVLLEGLVLEVLDEWLWHSVT
jgi:hypothetical protein